MASSSSSALALPEIQTGKRKQFDDQEKYQQLLMKRRKDTLYRKSRELAIKSDAQVCVICIDPKGEIDVFPEPKEAKAIINKYIDDQIDKEEENLAEEKKSEALMALLNLLDSKLEALDERIQIMSSKATNSCNDFGGSKSLSDTYFQYQPSFPSLLDDIGFNNPIPSGTTTLYADGSLADLNNAMPITSCISPSFNQYCAENDDDGVLLQELLAIYGTNEYSMFRENHRLSLSLVPEISSFNIPLLEWDNPSHVAGISDADIYDTDFPTTRIASEEVKLLQQTAVPVAQIYQILH